MDLSNCERCKKIFDSVERIPKILQCGCIICSECINNDLEYYDKFLCKAHKQEYKGKVTDLKDLVSTENFQNQLNSFLQEAKLDQRLNEFQQHFNKQQMKYIMYKKAILTVQNFFYSIIQQVCQQQTKNVCEMLQSDMSQGAQIVSNLKFQMENLEKILNSSSETRQQHEERLNTLTQVQASYEITKQMIQAYKQIESQENNESELTSKLSESCFDAINFVQEQAMCQILEAQDVAKLIAQFLLEKEQYDIQEISVENIESFVKKFSSQVISAATLRENSLNKSNFCQDKNILEQFKQNSNQRLIQKLYKVIELSKTSQEIEQASANAITILKNLNPNFNQKNFEGIKIKGADLSDAILLDCNLRNANLQEVNLKNAKLTNCNLNKGNLTNVLLERPEQSPILPGQIEGINSLVISPDNQFIIIGLVDYSIQIWNLLTSTLLRTLSGHKGSIMTVAITSDQK